MHFKIILNINMAIPFDESKYIYKKYYYCLNI